jgi:uncharacterized protein YutE (UPF0331/DUF86 family)
MWQQTDYSTTSSDNTSNLKPELEKINNFKKELLSNFQKLNDKKLSKESQEELSRLVVLLHKVEKLIWKTFPGNTWWEKIPNIFTPDRRKLLVKEFSVLVDFIQIAIESLFQEVPNVELAKRIRIDIERVVRNYEHPRFGVVINRFMDAQRSPSVPLKVISGLIAALVINGFLTSFVLSAYIYVKLTSENSALIARIKTEIQETTTALNKIDENAIDLPTGKDSKNKKNSGDSVNNKFPTATAEGIGKSLLTPDVIQQNNKLNKLQDLLAYLQKQQEPEQKIVETMLHIVLVILAGTLGSIVSILIRIEGFQDKRYVDPLVPFFIGAFKPIIGASFGVLFFALISSGIVTIQSIEVESNKKVFIIFSIAFVVGFSERLAKDAIDRAEGILGGSQSTDQDVEPPSPLENAKNEPKPCICMAPPREREAEAKRMTHDP